MISIVVDYYFDTANNNTYFSSSSKCYHWEQQTMQILVEYNCIPQKKHTNAYFQDSTEWNSEVDTQYVQNVSIHTQTSCPLILEEKKATKD